MEVDQNAKISQPTAKKMKNDPSQLVYDPAMGVISKGLQDLWNHQELERNQHLQKAKLRQKSKELPPVRS